MVKIRLSRGGSKKRPYYKVVVLDERKPRDAGDAEKLGFYNPIAQGGEKRFHIDLSRYDALVKTGAQPTDRVKSLVKEFRELHEGGGGAMKAEINARKRGNSLTYKIVVEQVSGGGKKSKVDEIGSYTPPVNAGKEPTIDLDLDRYRYWKDRGAVPSEAVVRYVKEYQELQDTGMQPDQGPHSEDEGANQDQGEDQNKGTGENPGD